MDFTMVETTLLEIIKEANHLNDNELEVIPETNVKVKKGRADEFRANARFYFEYINNIKIAEGMDYVTDAYNMLKNKVEEENREYYESVSYDIESSTKEDIKVFDNLNETLKKALEDYHKLEEMKRTTKSEAILEGINKDINALNENVSILTNRINELKNNVNSTIIKNIDKELESIRQNYLNTRLGTKIAAAQDGTMLLQSDVEEYNKLVALKAILSNVKENDVLTSAFGLAIVNEHQKDIFMKIINETKLFSLLKPKEEVKESKKEVNADIIKRITERLREIENIKLKGPNNYAKTDGAVLVLKEYVSEYNNLLAMLRILNNAKDKPDYFLKKVWDIASVNEYEVVAFEKLLEEAPLFSKDNPKVAKERYNIKELEKIEARLKEIEHNYNSFNGVSNIPAIMASDGTIVLKSDAKEYNALLEMKKMLQDIDSKNLVQVFDIGYVKYENADKFRKMLGDVSIYSDRLPKHEENEIKAKEIIAELQELIEKAKKTENPEMAKDKEVLAEDEEKYDALSEMYGILKASLRAQDVEEVNGVKIAKEYVEAYKKNLKIINKEPTLPDPPKNLNEEKIEEINKEIEELKNKAQGVDQSLLANNGLVLKEDEKKYDDLVEMLEYLDLGLKDENAVIINGLSIPSAHVERCKTILGIKTNNNVEKKKELNAEIEKLKARAKEKAKDNPELLMDNGFILKEDEEKYYDLLDMINYLNLGENLEDGVVVDGVTIPKGYEEKYRELVKKHNNVKPPLPGKGDTRKKVIGIRKMGKKLGEFILNHKKAIIGTILTAFVIMLGLQLIGPALVCANCSFAYAVPGLQWLFNGLNSIIAPFCGLHAAPISGPVTMFATKLGGIVTVNSTSATLIPALLQAGIGLGALGFGTYKLANYVKKIGLEESKKLGLDNEEVLDNSKIDEIKEKTKEKVKGLLNTLKNHVLRKKSEKSVPKDEKFTEEEKTKRDLIQKRIDERIKNLHLNSNNFIKASKIVDTPIIKGDPAPVQPLKITIPTNEELIDELDDGKLNIARAQNLVDNVGSKDTKEIKDIRSEVNKVTKLDISSYNMDSVIGKVRYIIDVAKASKANSEDIMKTYIDGINEIQRSIDITSDETLKASLKEELNKLNVELNEIKSKSLTGERGL